MRTCGECRLCCRVFPLPVLDKPADQWCRFVAAAGCLIHDCGQPPVCREYDCYWLEHEEAPERYRPDRIEIVVTEYGTLTVRDAELPILLLNQSHAAACQSRDGQTLVDELVSGGAAALILCGPHMRIAYDRDRYPAISPRDIEVALRYEQSQDAEQLKQLGAVPDDYRPLSWAEAEALTPK
jgi:uncharacterized protein